MAYDNQLTIRPMKLDFPHFRSGDDLVGWLYKANQFFTYHNTRLEHHILIDSFHLEGKAMPWFHELKESRGLCSCFTITIWDSHL